MQKKMDSLRVTSSSSYLKRALAIRAHLRQGYDYDNLVEQVGKPRNMEFTSKRSVSVTVAGHNTSTSHPGCELERTTHAFVSFPANKAPPRSHSTLLLVKERRLNAFLVFYHLSPIRLRAPSLCFLKQEVNVPLFCSQTQQVQKAMDEKRFEDAVKLRGRYDRTVRRVQ